MPHNKTPTDTEHQASHLGPKASLQSYFDELLSDSNEGSQADTDLDEPSSEPTEAQVHRMPKPTIEAEGPQSLAPSKPVPNTSHAPEPISQGYTNGRLASEISTAAVSKPAASKRSVSSALPLATSIPKVTSKAGEGELSLSLSSLKKEQDRPSLASEQRYSSSEPQRPAPQSKQAASIEALDFAPAPEPELEAAQKQQLQHLLSQQTLDAEPVIKTKTQQKTAVQAKVKTREKVEVDVAAKLNTTQDIATSAAEPATSIALDTTAEVETVCESTLASNLEWADNGRPQWAQERFDALLFDVSGLTLAVPLISLGQIVPITDELTPIFGQSDWFMGIMPNAQGQLRLINTALFVMPEKYNTKFLESAAYAISIDGVPWALAVDKVNQPISLDPSEINWRGQRSKRPWLAGTVKSAMCALLDIPNMAHLLNQSDKKLSS